MLRSLACQTQDLSAILVFEFNASVLKRIRVLLCYEMFECVKLPSILKMIQGKQYPLPWISLPYKRGHSSHGPAKTDDLEELQAGVFYLWSLVNRLMQIYPFLGTFLNQWQCKYHWSQSKSSLYWCLRICEIWKMKKPLGGFWSLKMSEKGFSRFTFPK